jgi:hypothetical protein
MLKAPVVAILAGAVFASPGEAARLAPASGLVVRVDWQVPEQLPPLFRNHCTYENFSGRPYCSNRLQAQPVDLPR